MHNSVNYGGPIFLILGRHYMLVLLGNSLSSTLRQYFNDLAAQPGSSIELLPASLGLFRSTEPFSELFYNIPGGFDAHKTKIQGQHVTILQSTTAPVSENCMQLLLAIDTLKRYGAETVTVAMPFAAFARQDRPFDGSFASVAGDTFPRLLKAAGADRIITSEIHSQAAEKFYLQHFGADNVVFLSSTLLFADHIKQKFQAAIAQDRLYIGAPDGANKPNDFGQFRASELIRAVWNTAPGNDRLDRRIMIEKSHKSASETKIENFDPKIIDGLAVFVDDMSDTGGTTRNAASAAKEHGASAAYGALTHALLTEQALEELLNKKSPDGSHLLGGLIVTDTVPGINEKIKRIEIRCPGVSQRLTILPTGPQFAEAIMKFSI